MKTKILFTIISILAMYNLCTNAQNSVRVGDTIKLKTTNPEGRTFIWQSYIDSLTWNNINGSTNKTMYIYIVPSNLGSVNKLCFLAKVTEVSKCNFISNVECLNLLLTPVITFIPVVVDSGTTSATIQANIGSDNGYTITSRGICYNTSGNPTVNDNTVLNGTGTGTFLVNITNLSASTKYYARIFATNSKGTSYSQQISFKTKSN